MRISSSSLNPTIKIFDTFNDGLALSLKGVNTSGIRDDNLPFIVKQRVKLWIRTNTDETKNYKIEDMSETIGSSKRPEGIKDYFVRIIEVES